MLLGCSGGCGAGAGSGRRCVKDRVHHKAAPASLFNRGALQALHHACDAAAGTFICPAGNLPFDAFTPEPQVKTAAD